MIFDNKYKKDIVKMFERIELVKKSMDIPENTNAASSSYIKFVFMMDIKNKMRRVK